MRKIALTAAAAMLLAISAVLVAQAATTTPTTTAPAPAAATNAKPVRSAAVRVMTMACASKVRGVNGILVFIRRPSECDERNEKVVRFQKDFPVYVCRRPGGQLRLVSSLSRCARARGTRQTLPRQVDTLFCVNRLTTEMHWFLPPRNGCKRNEFKVVLKKRNGNVAPVARPDSAKTDEATVKNIAVLANDTDADGNTLHVGPLNLTGTKGSVTKNPNGTLRYDPNGKFESLKAGETATDTFEYKANDGKANSNSAKVTVTITGVNDAPVAQDDAATTDKAHSKQIAVLSNDSDVDGNPLTVASVDTTGTQGSVTINGDGTVTYDPNHKFDSLASNQSAHDTFKYKANDGTADSNSATVDVTVTGANDAPVVTTSAGSASYTEGGPAATIDPGLTVADPDSANMASAQVRISSGFQAGDALVFVDQSGITGTYNSGTGVLTLTGSASKSDYQAALRSVTYIHSGDNPSTSKTAEFTVNDGALTSNAATRNITVTPVNDAPTVNTSSGQASYTEGSAAVQADPALTVSDPDSAQLQGAVVSISANFSSADGDTLNFVNQNGISGVYNSGTGVLTLTGNASVADYQTALRSITFSNTSDNPSTATRTVSFKVTDTSGADSNTATRDVAVAVSNDAPVVTTTAGNTAVNEDAQATIDAGLTVTDADDTNIESAQVRVSSGFQSGDDLIFVNQNGISGVYNTGTGVLTMTGTASLSDYQTGLRSIKFRTTNDNPSSPKTIEFKVNDGTADSNLATKNVVVTGVNDAPTVTTSSGQASYTEGSTAVQPDPALTVTDPDSAQLQGAVVSISANFSSADGDTLNFVNQNGISGVYNSGTGILTMSGNSSVANYEAALRSITFSNTSDNPSTATRTVSFKVTDTSAADSNTATRDVGVSVSNDAPVVTTSSGSTAYTEGDPATTIDGALTVTDADDTNLEGGQVRISSNFESGDDLVFVNQNGISGIYNTGTGVLVLTGTASKSDYQTALRSIRYRHTGDNPATSKTVEFKLNDGDVDSNLATKNISVTRVNDAPTLTTTAAALSYTEGDGPVAADSGLTLTDPDSTQVQGATVQITGGFVQADDELAFTNTANITGVYNDTNGTMTLSGTTTLANYQTALRSVTFENVNQNPSGSKTLSFQATDAEGAASNVATRIVNLSNANDAPVVTTSASATSYTEGDPATTIDGALTVTDADDTDLEGGQVRISSNFESGDDLVFVNQNGISGVYNTGTGVLTLTGTASKSDYETALRSIQYRHTGNNPSSGKVVELKVNDGSVDSAAATKSINITGVNDGPTITTTAAALAYTEGDGAVAADSGLTLTDPENDQISGATVQITGAFVQADDELAFTTQSGITGVYNDTNGTMTLSGTTSVANYQTALRSVTFENVNQNPSGSKTLSFQATDAGTPNEASNVATRIINLSGVNDAPVVTTTAGNTAYSEGGATATVDSGVTVTDVDDTNIESAQVRISSNFQSGDDLVFVNQNGISGVYNTGTGVLTMTGTASKSDYQTAFQSIQFQTTNNNPSSPKTVEFKANDGSVDSNLATKDISITGVNDAPTMTTSGGTASFTEGSTAVQPDPALTLTDADSTQIQSATVSITTNFTSADGDTLSFTNTANITGVYNSGTGVLTLTGTDTVANYEAALRSVTYSNTSDNPSSATRTVAFQAKDAEGADSNAATRNVTVTPVNDAPVVTTSSGSTAYTEGGAAATIDGSLTVTDVDDTNLESGVVRISSGFQSGDDLVFVNQNGISGVYNTGTGVLTLAGTASKSDYQTALRSIQFQSTNNNPVTSKDVEFKVNDGSADSNAATKNIAVTPVNSPPTIGAGHTLNYTENDPATAADAAVTVTEPEGDGIASASASITTGFQSGEDALSWTDNLGDSIVQGVSTSQTINLVGPGTAAQYQAALRDVKYQNSSEAPSTGARTVTFSATDVFAATGNGASTINVTAVDDPPVAVNDPGGAVTTAQTTVLEDALATAIPVLNNDTDVDGGPKTISSASDPANGTVVLTGGSPGAHTGLTYQPDPNYCNDPPGNTPDTFTYTLNGGSQATVSMTVTCVNDAPNVTGESFTAGNGAVGNTTFVARNTVASPNNPADGDPATPDPTDTSPVTSRPHKTITGDILSNDSDVEGNSLTATSAGTAASNGVNGQTEDGGTVTVQSDGDFVVEPEASTSCTPHSDSFTYVVTDNGTPSPSSSTGTVTFAITGCVWYVNNHDAQGNNGTSEKPFDTLAQAQTASGTGHSIFVYDGNDTSTGYDAGIDLKANQKLIGEAATLTVGSDTLHSADAANKPTLTDSNADVVVLAAGNDVKGLNIDPQGTAQGGGIAGGAGDASGTIDDVNIVDTGNPGFDPSLELNGTSGTWNISNFTVDSSAATTPPLTAKGVLLNGAGTVNFLTAGTISLNTKGAAALDADTTNMGTGSVFDSITVAGSGSGGVRLFNLTAGSNTQLGDGSGNDLNLTTTSGATAALRISSGQTVSVPSAGTANISATGGPAIDVDGTAGISLNFDDVDSTNSATDGVRLSGLGTGSYSSNVNSSIAGAAGTAFNVSGSSSGGIIFPGDITNGSGQSVSITGRTGGTVTMNGQISDSNDAGGGITVSSNSGGNTEFTSALKTINTTTSAGAGNPINDAVVLSSNTGHTIDFTGGNLDIDSFGKGFTATGGGTVTVTDPFATPSNVTNTINSTSGVALTVTGTTIGANGLRFHDISAGNNTAAVDPANGIVLNNTGSGALTVTSEGSGTCTTANSSGCNGGTIQNVTSHGILLTSVGGALNLARMRVVDSLDDGINGTNVSNGLNLDNAAITSNGDTANTGGVHGDHGVDMTGLTGTSTFTNNDISNNIDSNVVVSNSSGTSNLNVTGGSYSGAFGGMGDGIYMEALATGSHNLNVQGPITFDTNKDSAVQHGSSPGNTSDNDVTVNNATVTTPAAPGGGPACGGGILGGGITVSEGGPTSGPGSNTDVSLTNNNIQNSCIGAIAVGTTGSVGDQQIANVDVTIDNNTIGTTGVAGSGSTQGNGIFIDSNGNSNVRALITDNTVRQWTNRNGLHLDVIDGDAAMDATVQNNVFTEPNSAFAGTTTRGMTLQLGTGQPGDSIDACLDIGHPTTAALKNQVFGTGESPQPDIRYLHEGPSSVVKLAGYSGPASPTITDIANYLQPRNNIGGTPSVTGTANSGSSTTITAASCSLPAP